MHLSHPQQRSGRGRSIHTSAINGRPLPNSRLRSVRVGNTTLCRPELTEVSSITTFRPKNTRSAEKEAIQSIAESQFKKLCSLLASDWRTALVQIRWYGPATA